MKTAKCRYCGQTICFIATRKGRLMPVNSTAVVPEDCQLGRTYINLHGDVLRVSIAEGCMPDACEIYYEQHWSTCSGAVKARKKK